MSAERIARPNEVSNTNMTIQKITFTASLIDQGNDVECRKCLVSASGVATVGEDVAAAAAGCPLPIATYVELPIANTNMLHFKGVENEFVYLISFL
jgi:hypothetical protein